MEVFGARPDEPAQACFAEIAASDLFIGIYAYRYGFVPPNSAVSITEQEFDFARQKQKPLFCFSIDDACAWPPTLIESGEAQRKLSEFKRRISEAAVRETFSTPTDLAYKIGTTIGRYLAEANAARLSADTLEITHYRFTTNGEFDVTLRNVGDTDLVIHSISVFKLEAPRRAVKPELKPTAEYHIPVDDIPIGGNRRLAVSHVVAAHSADRILIDLESWRIYKLRVVFEYNRDREASFEAQTWRF